MAPDVNLAPSPELGTTAPTPVSASLPPPSGTEPNVPAKTENSDPTVFHAQLPELGTSLTTNVSAPTPRDNGTDNNVSARLAFTDQTVLNVLLLEFGTLKLTNVCVEIKSSECGMDNNVFANQVISALTAYNAQVKNTGIPSDKLVYAHHLSFMTENTAYALNLTSYSTANV